MNEKIFKREEMEERMPDFIFGRLDPKEKELFEQSLPNYPDLEKEVTEVREVFRKLNNLDIDNYLDRKTRNIPVKVSAKIQQKRNPLNIFARPGFVSLAAGIGIVLIVVSIFLSKINKNEPLPTKEITREEVTNTNQPLFPQLEEVKSIAEKEKLDIATLPEISDFSILDNYSASLVPANEYLDELITEQLVEFLPNDSKFTKNIFDYRFYESLNNLDENDFQQIIEELKNVKI